MENLLFGLASSRLYKELGIATPQTAPIITNQNNILVGSQSVLGLLDQNISTIMACKTLQPSSTDKDISDNILCETSNKWYVLYNKQFRQKLLDIMTEDCFDQYTTLLIADELRTDTDRHWRNFFFYKSQ